MTRSAWFRPEILLFALAGLVVFVGAGAIAWRAGFDGLYGQDPFAYYSYAVGPLRESLARGDWLPPFFWPPGYPLLVALAAGIVGPTPFAGQLVSLTAGATVPILTAWLCREVLLGAPDPLGANRSARTVGEPLLLAAAPFTAALAAGFCALLWQRSIMNMSDTTALAAATLGAAALARYVRTGRGVWLSLAAAGLAWAVLTRWAFALVAIPCAACALIALAQHPPRIALGHASAAAMIVIIVLIPVIGPVTAHAMGQAPQGAPFIGDLQVIGWHPLNPFRHEFLDMDGYRSFRLPNGLYYAAAPARWFFFTPLLAPFILPGSMAVLRARAAAPALLLVAWPMLTFVFIAGMADQNPRFALPCLPPLAILLAIGLVHAARLGGKGLHATLGVVFVAALSWMAAGGVRLTGTLIDRKTEHLSAMHWTEERVPPDARLLTFGLTQTFQYYGRMQTIDLFPLTPDDLAELSADARPMFLLLDVAGVEAQWRGRSPFELYRWLRDGPGLVEMDRQGDLILFRVSP